MIRVFVFVIAALATAAHAEPPSRTVALLPLDSDKRLDIYGQALASEIARALAAGQVDVVVVGPRVAVPERAVLIVDGTITAKGDDVTLAVRVRKRIDGTVLDTLTSSAPLAELDRATGELSARLLPSVRAQLDRLDRPETAIAVHATPAAPPKPRPLMISAIASTGATGVEPLRDALVAATGAWATGHAREPIAGGPLPAATATKLVAASTADLAIAFEVAGFEQRVHDGVPLGRARVRVRIASAAMVLFDRVVVTDSVVGDKRAPAKLAALVAREVLSILRPHLAKIGGWR